MSAVIKQFCGGDNVSARMLHKELFEFRPVCKIMLATNHKPIVRGTDEGIWRRMRLVPFLANFTEAQRDPGLEHKLKAEAPAILRWMVQGCQLWLSQGLSMPKAVKEATSEYRSSMMSSKPFLRNAALPMPQPASTRRNSTTPTPPGALTTGFVCPCASRHSTNAWKSVATAEKRATAEEGPVWCLGQKRLTAKSDDTPSLSCDYQQGDIRLF